MFPSGPTKAACLRGRKAFHLDGVDSGEMVEFTGKTEFKHLTSHIRFWIPRGVAHGCLGFFLFFSPFQGCQEHGVLRLLVSRCFLGMGTSAFPEVGRVTRKTPRAVFVLALPADLGSAEAETDLFVSDLAGFGVTDFTKTL